jgi:hypothetical protein
MQPLFITIPRVNLYLFLPIQSTLKSQLLLCCQALNKKLKGCMNIFCIFSLSMLECSFEGSLWAQWQAGGWPGTGQGTVSVW